MVALGCGPPRNSINIHSEQSGKGLSSTQSKLGKATIAKLAKAEPRVAVLRSTLRSGVETPGAAADNGTECNFTEVDEARRGNIETLGGGFSGCRYHRER